MLPGRTCRLLRTAWLTPVLVLTSACRGAAPEVNPAPYWSLRVENHHVLDVNVFVIHGGQRSRIGVVTAAQNQRFRLPARLLGPGGEIHLAATRIGGPGELQTEKLFVERGSRVEWFIPRAFEHSAVSVHQLVQTNGSLATHTTEITEATEHSERASVISVSSVANTSSPRLAPTGTDWHRSSCGRWPAPPARWDWC
jgi:hypothetical protein